jgi:hypothetical protein
MARFGPWPKPGSLAGRVTGMADGTDLETTDRDRDCGQVTRTRRLEDQRGRMQDIEVTVQGWNVPLLIDAATKIQLAIKVGKIQAHESHGTRAVVTQARAHLARDARLHKVVFDQGCLDGTDLWWLDQQGLTCVVPAKNEHGLDRGRQGAGHGWRGDDGRPSGAYGLLRAGQHCRDGTVGDGSGGDHGADDV